jgi:hypothetical protein
VYSVDEWQVYPNDLFVAQSWILLENTGWRTVIYYEDSEGRLHVLYAQLPQ